ncbi:hypothetical protein TCAL_09287 [Tigriopus californicus]|uniref:DH domain-containing protein n=1 Tax=Tigriopus californicus TaxID=6832 RepID=A0A553P0D5_TIGCA|nr:hypothetical protein TCAL_09287 [Tigriopus californicus]
MTMDESVAPGAQETLATSLAKPGGAPAHGAAHNGSPPPSQRKRKRRGLAAPASPAIQPEGLGRTTEEQEEAEDDFDPDQMDRVSMFSLDTTLAEAPEVKRSKTMSRVTSLASVMTTPVARVGHALSRSISGARLPYSPSPGGRNAPGTPTKFFGRSVSTVHMTGSSGAPPAMRAPESPYGTLRRGAPGRNSATNITPYKKPQPTTNKQRPTRYWSSDFPETCARLDKQEIRLQEAIHEMTCGEEDLVDDLILVQKTYADSLLQLNILTPSEVEMVFGNIRKLTPIHRDLHKFLESARSPSTGIYRSVGQFLLHWTGTVRLPYIDYCSTLIKVKTFLDLRRDSDKDFRDFLQRCLESPFSRKLDLWAYLDVPRSRLVKYPLLLKQVLKFCECPSDSGLLTSAIHHLESILQDVDKAMAQARCQNTIARLDWLDDCPVDAKVAVNNASEEILEGVLRNNRGTKLECHLMDTVLILGRPSTRGQGGVKRLQVYRTPIPIEELVLEDIDQHGTVSMGSGSSSGSSGSSTSSLSSSGSKNGSFKSAFSHSQPSKGSSFRVSFRRGSLAPQPHSRGDTPVERNNRSDADRKQLSHTLMATDEHSKRQWLTSLQKTIDTHMAVRQEQEREVDSHSNPPAKTHSIVSRLKSGPRTAGLFQKNKRSPRIKASLSSTHVDSLKRGSAIKRLRTHAASTSALRPDNMPVFDENTPVLHHKSVPRILSSSGGLRLRSGTVGSAKPPLPLLTSGQHHSVEMRKRASSNGGQPLTPLNEKQSTTAVKSKSGRLDHIRREKLGSRTKSWGHLMARSEEHLLACSLDGQRDMPRYLTRSTLKKISKSMSDLLEL